MKDRAEQMREAAVQLVRDEIDLARFADQTTARVLAILYGNICALPLPPQPPLDAEVAGVVEVFAFLRGEGPLEGVWFGDDHPTEKGKFWWRKHLRSAADLIERLAREKAEAERRVKWVEAEINSCMDANFRQAMCINNTASALGPEISATIDGLPKAARHVRTRAEKAEAEVARLQDLLNKTAANNRTKARALRGRKGADHE